jgi:4a-hydroxytetrahydrobiopterin dehydratase
MPTRLTRTAASAAVEPIGWRLLLNTLVTSVPADDLAAAEAVARTVVQACGADADQHLRLELRPTQVTLTLLDTSLGAVTDRDVELAFGITDAVRDLGFDTVPTATPARPVQTIEIAIDALDIAAVRPFWKAALALEDEVTPDGSINGLVDPTGTLPNFWFQQMDEPRPQRNRIHFDITVPHDEADTRIAAALAAGGRLVSDDRARAFWILADIEGNEVCVCTWQDRDRC